VYQLYKIIVEVLFVKCGTFLELCTLVICIVILSLELCIPEIIGCVYFPTLTNEGFIQLFAHFIVNKAGGLPSESLFSKLCY